jgi:GT2 family glycosyltransferase
MTLAPGVGGRGPAAVDRLHAGRLRLGAVVIGRNEGERLERCLRSVLAPGRPVVYVDSGSSDGSVALAGGLGAVVVALDMAQPFTAARARNDGAARVLALDPAIDALQFVDGDCEVDAAWLPTAAAFLAAHADVAAVCGRRRERHPERSVYNRLCDLEWDTPVGEAKACGGDVLMRTAAFRAVGGFRPDLIAGEEPELCVRLRAAGWRIWRLGAEMTLHDAAMLHAGQWWKRCLRAGYAYAEGVSLHGAPPERHWVRESRSAWLWGLALPFAIAVAVLFVGPPALAAALVYPLQVLRLALRAPRHAPARWARAFFLVAGKFPEAIGQVKAVLLRALGCRAAIIEYK